MTGFLVASLFAGIPLAAASITSMSAYGDSQATTGLAAPDEDELNQSEEQRYGTDPNDWDTDNDTLPDHWEVAGQTPSGIPLPGADPLRRDYYYTVVVADGEGRLTESRLTDWKQYFAGLPIENPDGTTGANFHIVGIERQDRIVIDSSEKYDTTKEKLTDNREKVTRGPTERDSVHGTLVLVDFDWRAVGLAGAGGHFATAERDDRTIYHEIRHNLLGRLPPYVARCPDDQAHYCGDKDPDSIDHKEFPAELGTVFERSKTTSGTPIHNPRIMVNSTLVKPGESVSIQLDQFYFRTVTQFDRVSKEEIERVRIFGQNTSYFKKVQPAVRDRAFTVEIKI